MQSYELFGGGEVFLGEGRGGAEGSTTLRCEPGPSSSYARRPGSQGSQEPPCNNTRRDPLRKLRGRRILGNSDMLLGVARRSAALDRVTSDVISACHPGSLCGSATLPHSDY